MAGNAADSQEASIKRELKLFWAMIDRREIFREKCGPSQSGKMQPCKMTLWEGNTFRETIVYIMIVVYKNVMASIHVERLQTLSTAPGV